MNMTNELTYTTLHTQLRLNSYFFPLLLCWWKWSTVVSKPYVFAHCFQALVPCKNYTILNIQQKKMKSCTGTIIFWKIWLCAFKELTWSQSALLPTAVQVDSTLSYLCVKGSTEPFSSSLWLESLKLWEKAPGGYLKVPLIITGSLLRSYCLSLYVWTEGNSAFTRTDTK